MSEFFLKQTIKKDIVCVPVAKRYMSDTLNLVLFSLYFNLFTCVPVANGYMSDIFGIESYWRSLDHIC